jgi:pimeloyl-ACP methyl ester carboxylesterase
VPDQEALQAERAEARAQIKAWVAHPITLKRPLYFAPGLSDESGSSCWGAPDDAKSFRGVMRRVCASPNQVRFHSFLIGSPPQPPPYENFIPFGADLARRIWDDVAHSTEKVDIVCHSMGGLDTFAAIALLDDYPELGVQPLRLFENVITFDTPFTGFNAADNAIFLKLKRQQRPDEPTLLSQAVALKPGSLRMHEVDQNRDRFLRNLGAFYPRGADNFNGLLEVPHESASFGKRSDFAPEWRDRCRPYVWWEDTTHSGPKGVTRDPRAIVEVFSLLMA